MQNEPASMSSSKRKPILESIFGVFYIMTEGDFPSGGVWKFRFTIALLLIDGLQVLRSLAVSKFMWSSYSISIMRSVDLVALFFHTVQRVIPEWVFFSFAILIAIGAIVNAGYVMKLLRQGQVKIIWPLKILRMLVASIVTVFFTTVLEFLIYPVRCIDIGQEDNFSAVLHGGARACNPWDVPEMALSIVTIIVSTAFIVFSLVTTTLDFTINPLCRHPLAQCTGRLESLWTAFKVAALLLVYLAPFISAMACAVLLFLLSSFICYYHLAVLPFHQEIVNMVRGGIYFSTWAFCLGAIIIQHHPDQQTLQNWLLGALPVAFLLGMFVVYQLISFINGYLGVLRGQWDEQAKAHDHHGHGRRSRRQSFMSEATQSAGMLTARSVHDQFFDVKWETQRRFSHGAVAYLAARVLLHRRSQDDMLFLMSLLNQSLKDHPNSYNLAMFHLLVLRYVFKERNQAIAQEKLSKLQSANVSALDRRYLLFAVNKKTVQEGASESLGKGSISAVNLMEFDQRIEAARKSHRACVVSMKAFWKHVAKRRRQDKAAGEQALKMTEELDKFTRSLDLARQEYAWLYEKYPSSAPLLSAYASFCDHVLNDNRKADQLRQQVAVMESYGKIDEMTGEELEAGDDAGGMDLGFGGGGPGIGGGGDNKSVSTDSEPYRVRVSRYMQSWSHVIMSRDSAMLRGLHWRVRAAILCLVALSLASFVVTDLVLFNDVALKTIQDIDDTGRFRELAATAPHLLRSEMIEAQLDNEGQYLGVKQYLRDLTDTMLEDHYRIFEQISTSAIEKFYEEPNLEVNLPRPTGWEHAMQSFRHLGSDFARRVGSAATAQRWEHTDANFKLSDISQEKRDIAYVFENMIRYVLPNFDEAVAIYEHQMIEFGRLATTLTSVAAALTALLVVIIAVSVLRARSEVIKRVHSNRVSISLACELPRSVAVRFYKYFSDLELEMAMMEDEEEDERARMVAEDREQGRRLSVDDSAGMSQAGMSQQGSGKRRPSFSGNSVQENTAFNSSGRALKPCSSPLLLPEGLPPGNGDAQVQVHTRHLLTPLHAEADSPPDDDVAHSPASRLTADNLQRFVESTAQQQQQQLGSGPAMRVMKPQERGGSPPPPARGMHEDEEEEEGEEEEEDDVSDPFFGLRHPHDDKDDVDDDDEEDEDDEDEDEDDDDDESAMSGGEEEEEEEEEEGMGAGALSNARATDIVFVDRKRDRRADKKNVPKGKGGGEVRGGVKGATPVRMGASAGKSERMAEAKVRRREEEQKKEEEEEAAKRRKEVEDVQLSGMLRGILEDGNNSAEGFAVTPRNSAAPEAAGAGVGFPRSVVPGFASPVMRRTILRKDSEAELMSLEGRSEEDGMSPLSRMHKSLRFGGEEEEGNVARVRESFTLAREDSGGGGGGGQGEGGGGGVGGHAEPTPQEMAEEAEEESRRQERARLASSLELQDMSPEMHAALSHLQYHTQPWFNRFYVYVITLAALLALCMLYSLYPVRRIPTIVTMAPTMDKATARMSLSRACIFLARELVLLDGLPRMTKGEISGTLDAFIQKYEEADRAVRLGDKDLGILQGADHRSTVHNDVMYKLGCPWRQHFGHRRAEGEGQGEGEGGGGCLLPNSTYPYAAEDGLFNLQSFFLDALKTVLRKYGTRADEYVDTYSKHRAEGEDVSSFEVVQPAPNAYEILQRDRDLLFLDLMFEGDLHDGLAYVVFLFEEETKALLDYVHLEMRLLFGLYIAFLLLVFYASLFVKTMQAARKEVAKAREFAHTIPLHTLEQDEAETVRAFYMRDSGLEVEQPEQQDESGDET